MSIVCAVPSIRPQSLAEFKAAWGPLFEQHHVTLVVTLDGDSPRIEVDGEDVGPVSGVIDPADRDLVFNKTDACRNASFLWAAKNLDPDVFISLDDDLTPVEGSDPVADLVEPLGSKCCKSWLNTLRGGLPLVRGFPYDCRAEATVQVSHAGWVGSLDLDAPTQLMLTAEPPEVDERDFFKGVLPKGVLAPFSGMAIAFTREAAPHVYYAPAGPRVGINRFADIWLGTYLQRLCDERDWAIYYGNAVVHHRRASDVFKNLAAEAEGLRLNERWWKEGDGVHPYFAEYRKLRERYTARMSELLGVSA